LREAVTKQNGEVTKEAQTDDKIDPPNLGDRHVCVRHNSWFTSIKRDRKRQMSYRMVTVDGTSIFYRADVPNAKVVILDAGHFALDTKADEIAMLVRGFMSIGK
jgi:hypothetical protein